LATFAFAGVNREDGLSFNQRYLLEVLPPLAVVFAWVLDDVNLRPRLLWLGGAIGGGLVLVVLLGTPITGGSEVPFWSLRQLALMRLPLLLGAGLCAVWVLGLFRPGRSSLLALAVGACLAWGFTLHLASDVFAS